MPQLVYDLPPGTIIDNRYKLLKPLGQGGFGITYIAWDTELKRNVAVKECFPAGICLREQEGGGVRPIRTEWESLYIHALDDMRKEARTLASLNHANIVRIHDVIWGNGSVFCVMPWLGSGSLRQRMRDEDLSAEASIGWLRQLLDALGYLHQRGIIHRDLKPDNIMFDEAGSPIIIDFGAALNRPELTTTTTQGSFSRGYAAPEQITGKGSVGPWTDFYALSATWYELITGIRPEASDARLMQDDLAPIRSVSSRLSYPAELVALLQRNLSLKPAVRCQSVEQWLRCWENGTLPELPIPRHGRLKRIVLTASVLTALGCGVAYTAWRLAPAPAPARFFGASEEVKKELTQRVREFCEMESYAAVCAHYKTLFSKIKSDYDARQQELTARTAEACDRLSDSAAAEKLESVFYMEYEKLYQERMQACNKTSEEWMQAISGYRQSAAAIRADFSPANAEESALLSSVSFELEEEFRSLYDSVVAEYTSGLQTDSELEREKASLLSRMRSKESELREQEARAK